MSAKNTYVIVFQRHFKRFRANKKKRRQVTDFAVQSSKANTRMYGKAHAKKTSAVDNYVVQ